MNLLPQIIQLLTEAPGNFVYHLLTLLALQVVFAISLSQWRRGHNAQMAMRATLASGGLVLGRLLLLLASLLVANEPALATAVLPPLEYALNTTTAVLLVWALVPYARSLPRLGDVLALLGLLIIGLMTISFFIEWRNLVDESLSYNSTRQATIWGILQMLTLGCGWLLTLINRRTRWSLNPTILILLFLVHVVQFFYGPEPGIHIAIWIRLGHLIVLPLWAAQAYRQAIAPLLVAQLANQPVVKQLQQVMQLSAEIIGTFTPAHRLQQAIKMAGEMADAAFIGIGILPANDSQVIYLTSNLPQPETDAPRSWQLDLARWTPFQTVMEQGEGLELIPSGAGTRQLYTLYSALGLGAFGAMLIEPLQVQGKPIGVLLLAKRDDQSRWSAREKAVMPALAGYISQAIDNSRAYGDAINEATKIGQDTVVLEPEPDSAISGRIIALEEERERLVTNLETANNRLLQAETRAATATKRAHDLAAALDEMEQSNLDERVSALQREIETLRESLIEAEEAMALASAGKGGLSTEWVMMTITRYSGQLEAAQARIEALETEIAKRDEGPIDELMVSLIQELRTPMTSIGGFTDMLLGETMGILGVKQRDFLQRIQANVGRMGSLLDQMLQLTTPQEQVDMPEEELVDVREVIETAVSGVTPQVREKNLHLDLDIANDLPSISINRQALHQIMTNLLGNACRSSIKNGRVLVTARAETIPDSSTNVNEFINFLQVDITDSGGGIQQDDLPHVFDAQYRADNPLIAGVGDTGAGLSMAKTLTDANGGRIWVQSELGTGSTFSLLFPLTSTDTTADGDSSTANGNIRGTP